MKKSIIETMDSDVLVEKIKYIQENLRRAVDVQNKINNMETIKSFETDNYHVLRVADLRNQYIERNEYLNQIVQELNTMGYEIATLRPWQKDVRVQMDAVVEFFNMLKEEKRNGRIAI